MKATSRCEASGAASSTRLSLEAVTPRALQSPSPGAEGLGNPSEPGRGPGGTGAAEYIWAQASNPWEHVPLARACAARTSGPPLLLSSPSTYVDSAQSLLAA